MKSHRMCPESSRKRRISLWSAPDQHLRRLKSALFICVKGIQDQEKDIASGFIRGATGRGQIQDYFSRRRVFKGSPKETLDYREEAMLWSAAGGKERLVY